MTSFQKSVDLTWRDGPLYWNKQNNKYVRVPNKKVALKRLHNSQYLINFLIDEAKKYSTEKFSIWKNGPLHYIDRYNAYGRNSNKKITLKCLHKSQKTIDKVLNKARIYSKILEVYGISQNPNTKDFILVLNNINWPSGNKKIDSFIQEMQLNNKYDGIVFEWIPYDQFDKIKETSKYGSITEYSAIWKDGPLYYKRDSNKEIVLKYLHNSQNSIDFLINKVKKYIKNYRYDNFLKLYVFEWIPYDQFDKIKETSKIKSVTVYQFDKIKETSKNKSVTVYSAMWKDGPLYNKLHDRNSNKEVALKCLHNLQNPVESLINKAKIYSKILDIYGKSGFSTIYSAIWKDGPIFKKNQQNGNYTRDSNKEVTLKCLNKSQDPIESVINEAKKYLAKEIDRKIFKPYGISQNPDTAELILNNQQNGNYARDSNKEVTLKCLNKSPIETVIDEAKKYLTKEINRKIFKPYGISLNPNTNDFIVVLNNITWMSGNKEIDDFIHETQSRINDSLFEWIPYNQFNEIKEIDKNEFMTVCSAIWIDGPLCRNWLSEYTRDSNKEVTLKCLNNSQDLIEFVINEAKRYSTKEFNRKIFKPYGITQNPDSNNFILVLKLIDSVIKEAKNNSQNLSSEFLNKVKVYLTKMVNKNNILKIYGMSQDPITKEYIIVLYYAEAPEVLKGRPYTQVADIYSFDICKGIRPKLNEPEAPKSYINLMEKCWNLIPNDRPNIIELCQSLWSISINNSEIEKAENYRNLHLSSLMKNRQITIHYQAIYTSRFLNSFIKDLQ
ncbi:kinase-like domain-containing protein [Rhizophagus irregularis DAOM 181602=DAOM 197198]|nr:kinase-like domain-containing protein [Rhizophagus irregularis DAOM 181602=DAOM 197198]